MAVLCYLPIKIARPKLDRELKMCCIHLLVVMRKCLCGDMPVRSALKANKERTNKQKHISNQTVFAVTQVEHIGDTFVILHFFFLVCFLFFFLLGSHPAVQFMSLLYELASVMSRREFTATDSYWVNRPGSKPLSQTSPSPCFIQVVWTLQVTKLHCFKCICCVKSSCSML